MSGAKLPGKRCQRHLDTAYTAAKVLCQAEATPERTAQLLGGYDATCALWYAQAVQHALDNQPKETLVSARGWYLALKAAIARAALTTGQQAPAA
jgi:hypothetical protein